MARLTKTEKNDIIDRAVKDTFQARKQLLQRDTNLAAHALYDAVFPKEIRDKMKALPQGWMPTTTTIRINNYKNPPTVETAAHYYKRFPVEPAVVLPYEVLNKDIHINYDDPAQAAAIQTLYDLGVREKKLSEEVSCLRQALQQLIYPVTTDKKLIEIWPEGVKYMTPIDTTENLPAVTSTQVVELMAEFKEKRP